MLCHPAKDVLPLSIPEHSAEGGLGSSDEVAVAWDNKVGFFTIVVWILLSLPARVGALFGIAAAVELPLTVQNRIEVLALHPSYQAVTRTHGGPLQTGAVNIVPPAVGGLSEGVGRPLALKAPQAVGALFFAEVAADGHQHLSVGALEVEALAVLVDPRLIVDVVGLGAGQDSQQQHHQQGRQDGQGAVQQSGVHPGAGPVGALVLGQGLDLERWVWLSCGTVVRCCCGEGFSAQMFCVTVQRQGVISEL